MTHQKIVINDNFLKEFQDSARAGDIRENIQNKLMESQSKRFEQIGIDKDGLELLPVEESSSEGQVSRVLRPKKNNNRSDS